MEKIKLADDFYSLAPKYRTKVRLQDMVEQELDKAREEGYEECKKDFAVGVGLATDTEFSEIVGKIADKLTTK